MIGLRKYARGVVLAEAMLAFGVLSLAFAIILPVFWNAIDSMGGVVSRLQADYLFEEQLGVVEYLRDEGWANLDDGRFYLSPQGGQWTKVATTSSETVGKFRRWIEIDSAQRDATGALVESGGVTDPSTKVITSQVEWDEPRAGNLRREVYLTRYLDNLAWIQTTQAEFDLGEKYYVEVTNNDGGEFRLAGGCPAGSPESLIYDDQLRNGWRANCDGLRWWQWQYWVCRLFQFFANGEIETDSVEHVHGGSSYAIKIIFYPPGSGSWPAWVRLWNMEGICTLGFRFLKFQAYNPSPTEELTFDVTAVQDDWENATVTLPPNPQGEWEEIFLDYSQLTEDASESLTYLYFHKAMSAGDPQVEFWIDQVELTGGMGGSGYYEEGTLVSQAFDAGSPTVFNRISWIENLPANTRVGFQVAVNGDGGDPWEFYGPAGTTDPADRYTDSVGSGLDLGHNTGRYVRWKAYLNSDDGVDTPEVSEVTVNYSP